MLTNMLAAMLIQGEPAAAAGSGMAVVGVGLGIGLALLGAGLGLGWIGSQTAQAIARQPAAANDIRGTSLLIAFLMEGATIIAIIMSLVAKIVG
jgi:F-type H+-transporting ATPase subunit c